MLEFYDISVFKNNFVTFQLWLAYNIILILGAHISLFNRIIK